MCVSLCVDIFLFLLCFVWRKRVHIVEVVVVVVLYLFGLFCLFILFCAAVLSLIPSSSSLTLCVCLLFIIYLSLCIFGCLLCVVYLFFCFYECILSIVYITLSISALFADACRVYHEGECDVCVRVLHQPSSQSQQKERIRCLCCTARTAAQKRLRWNKHKRTLPSLSAEQHKRGKCAHSQLKCSF